MDILVYCWGSNCEASFICQLEQLHISYVKFEREMHDYHSDSLFAQEMLKIIHGKQISAVFSFDYFPLISILCEINHIPYITWIYDCPMLTLQSKTLGNDSNYIYCFDRIYTEYLIAEGAKHCFHLPLGGDGKLYERIKNREKKDLKLVHKNICDISFLGNLYNGDKNRYRTAEFSEYTRGYLEGIIESQSKIYGYNFVKELIPDVMIGEISEVCNLKLGELYRQSDRRMAADLVNMEVTAREREAVLRKLGERYSILLYTGSDIPDDLKESKIINRGYADYEKEMPFIFHNSKINLNITSRSIESGVPLRIFDILSCRGFCLTNYQPEVDELFVDGEELVMYTDMDDMMDKVQYYLSHEEERKRIAENGQLKLAMHHDLADKIEYIFQQKGSIL